MEDVLSHGQKIEKHQVIRDKDEVIDGLQRLNYSSKQATTFNAQWESFDDRFNWFTMSEQRGMIVNGSDFPSELVAEQCMSRFRYLSKNQNNNNNKKSSMSIDMANTGDRKTNLMLAFLQCQMTATKSCGDFGTEYKKCHNSFMGVGSYNGKRGCGDEMMSLYNCLKKS